MLEKGTRVWLVPERCWDEPDPIPCTLIEGVAYGGHHQDWMVPVRVEADGVELSVARSRIFFNEHRCLEAIQMRLELAELHVADDWTSIESTEVKDRGVAADLLRKRNILLGQRLLGRLNETLHTVYAYDYVWTTSGESTYLAHQTTPVSTDPAIAAMVDAANVLIHGHVLTKRFLEDQYPINLWGRLGFRTNVTLEEFDALRADAKKALSKLMEENRLTPEGETYFPADVEGTQNPRATELACFF